MFKDNIFSLFLWKNLLWLAYPKNFWTWQLRSIKIYYIVAHALNWQMPQLFKLRHCSFINTNMTWRSNIRSYTTNITSNFKIENPSLTLNWITPSVDDQAKFPQNTGTTSSSFIRGTQKSWVWYRTKVAYYTFIWHSKNQYKKIWLGCKQSLCDCLIDNQITKVL